MNLVAALREKVRRKVYASDCPDPLSSDPAHCPAREESLHACREAKHYAAKRQHVPEWPGEWHLSTPLQTPADRVIRGASTSR